MLSALDQIQPHADVLAPNSLIIAAMLPSQQEDLLARAGAFRIHTLILAPMSIFLTRVCSLPMEVVITTAATLMVKREPGVTPLIQAQGGRCVMCPHARRSKVRTPLLRFAASLSSFILAKQIYSNTHLLALSCVLQLMSNLSPLLVAAQELLISVTLAILTL